MNTSEFLARFIPRYRVAMLSDATALPAKSMRRAVLVFLDIVGFTAMSDELVRQSPFGAEEVARIVNAALGDIGRIADEYGGEITAVAGDAAWLAWFFDANDEAAGQAALAAQAALAIRDSVHRWRLGSMEVRARLTIATGAVDLHEVGGIEGQWLGLLRGDALADVARAEGHTLAGQIVVTPAVWRLLSEQFETSALAGGYRRLEHGRAGSTVPISRDQQALGLPAERLASLLSPMVGLRADEASAGRWSGEFRLLTVAFVRFAPQQPEKSQDLLRIAEIAQAAVAAAGGVVHQFLEDEKGLALVCLFGLPPRSHTDDAVRAVQASLRMERELDLAGAKASIGLSTGRVFCTIYRSGSQLAFAVVGPAMNLAARLAGLGLGLVGDDEVIKAVEGHHTLSGHPLPPQIIKGKAEPLRLHQLRSMPVRRPAAPLFAANEILPGRADAAARCDAALDRLLAGDGSVLILEGEAGLGKTELAARVSRRAGAMSVRCLVGQGEEIEVNSRYFPWRKVVADLIGGLHQGALEQYGLAADDAALIAAAMGDAPSHTDQSLTDEGRDERVRALLVGILSGSGKSGPMVLVLEDLHWFDASSRLLLAQLAETRPRLLFVVTARPPGQPSDEDARLWQGETAEVIRLQLLGRAETDQAFCRLLGASNASPDLIDAVQERTDGNPFFIGELSRLLQERKAFEVVDGEVTLSSDLPAPRALDSILRGGTTARLEGLVMARLDGLAPAARALIDVACVMGRTFASADLLAVAGQDERVLAGLQAAELLMGAEDRQATFRHALIREVAYQSLSVVDRRRWHSIVADRLQAGEAGQRGQIDAVLAHHLDEAGRHPEAIQFLARAGRTSLSNNANKDALSLYGRALTLLENGTSGADGGAAYEIELGLGEASQRLSRYADAEAHKGRALAMKGVAVPAGTAPLVLAILREVAVQVAHRKFPERVGRNKSGDPDSAPVALELGNLVETYFYLGQSLRSLFAALKALNLAESSAAPNALARGYAIMGTIVAFAGMSALGRRYGERAMEWLPLSQDNVAAWWVPLVVGVSRLSAGDLDHAHSLMTQSAAAAQRVHDHRHWRDAVENLAIIAAMRGDWNSALEGVASYRASAQKDRDSRYLTAALREQAYYLLQLGRFVEARESLRLLRGELDRGPSAERDAASHDLHAIAAGLALAQGDRKAAAAETELALGALASMGGSTSFPNMHWSMLLLARVTYALSLGAGADRALAARHRSQLDALCRAIRRQAAAHPVGGAAASITYALRAKILGRARQGAKHLAQAIEVAGRLGLDPERSLAEGLMADFARPEIQQSKSWGVAQ